MPVSSSCKIGFGMYNQSEVQVKYKMADFLIKQVNKHFGRVLEKLSVTIVRLFIPSYKINDMCNLIKLKLYVVDTRYYQTSKKNGWLQEQHQ